MSQRYELPHLPCIVFVRLSPPPPQFVVRAQKVVVFPKILTNVLDLLNEVDFSAVTVLAVASSTLTVMRCSCGRVIRPHGVVMHHVIVFILYVRPSKSDDQSF